MKSCFPILVAIVFSAIPSRGASAQQLTAEELTFFESKIRPVLVKECYGCHSSKAGNVRGGLRLDSQELMWLGGSSGPAIVPGNLEESLLFNAINHEDFVMPPKRKLSADVIQAFATWIEMGAPDPRQTARAEIQSSISEQDIEDARQNFWAYQTPVKVNPPVVADPQWPENDIDRFVLARLDTSELKPAGDAVALDVIRRLYFDLVGLPPTPEQIESFETEWEKSPKQAIHRIVDRLLDQSQFGERWAQHWFDVARYAESTGREVNMTFPHAWRYRDYVIDSFNQDKPFDRFVQEQIAGDLLPAASDREWAENLIATTFLAIGPKNVNEQNRFQFQMDLIDEQIDATTRVFLGASVACARCHDHKFDAIRQTDYYALAGVFGNANTYFGNPPSEYGTFTTGQMRRTSSLLVLPIEDPNPFDKRYDRDELENLREELREKMREAAAGRQRIAAGDASAQEAIRNRQRLSNEMSRISAKLAVVDAEGNPRSYCMGVQERETPGNARLLVRGEIDQPAQEVQRGFPSVLCLVDESIDPGSSGRLELARWIGSDRNPLTARVMVNRIWQKMIGRGIVTSTENFGVTGQRPSHPELLDHLAIRFVESGWSVKTLVRDIATSHVYRISSEFDEASHQYDPDNALVWRANPRRLDAEAIRDAMLCVSGDMDLARPRGSEVAKAGFQRVVGGFLGDPREAFRNAMSVAEQNRREVMRESLQGNGRPRFSSGRFRRGGNGSMRAGSRGGGVSRLNDQPSFAGPMSRSMQDAGRLAFESTIREATRKITSQLDMEDANYRSVYLPIVRDNEPRSLSVFDFADSSTVTGARESSNTANQALFMMNNRFVIRQSEAFAERLMRSEGTRNDRIRLAFVLAYGRPPTSQERAASVAFVSRFLDAKGDRANEEASMVAFCQSLFASAEFRYID